MVELPEAVNLEKELNNLITGKKITKVIAAFSPHKFCWYEGDPEAYNDLLSGYTISGVKALGGMLEITVDGSRILLSEGINLRIHEDQNQLPKKHQLAVLFSDNTAFSVSIQMYGGVCCFKNDLYENIYYQAAKNKPSPLSKEFNYSYYKELIEPEAMQKLSVKAFLATEQRVPGLGNGVLQEILYDAMIHPKRKVNSLTKDEIETLFQSVKKTIKIITDQGGRDTEKDIYGEPRKFITRASKNGLGKTCTRCGYPIVKASYMGGSIYFCDVCQKV